MNARIKRKKARIDSVEFFKDTFWGKARKNGLKVYLYMPIDPFSVFNGNSIVEPFIIAHTCKPKFKGAHARSLKYLIDIDATKAFWK